MRHREHQHRPPRLLWWGVLALVVIFGFYVRLLGVSALPPEQFTEADAYLYLHQAAIVSDQGFLPSRDVRRWVPVGRDTSQSLNLYPVVLGYAHRFLSVLIPDASVYGVVVYAPVVCFSLSLLVFCVFLAVTEGFFVSLSVGVILATLPGTIERSSAGFGDRDAFCLLLGLSAVVSYVFALRQSGVGSRFLWTLVSGFLMFLGGLAWEGFGVFLSVIVCVEVWRFLTTDTEEGFRLYVVWVLCFVPPLYLTSAAYRSGEGWSTHVFAFLLLPPVGLLGLRLVRAWLLRKSPWMDRLSAYRRGLSLLLLLLALGMGGVFLLSLLETFALTTVAFGTTPLMQSIGELVAPHFGYWLYRYGSVFLTGSVGLSLLPVFRFGGVARPLSFALGAFCVCVFFRQPIASVSGVAVSAVFFGCALFAVLVSFIHLAWQRGAATRNDARSATCRILSGVRDFLRRDALTSVAMLAWCVFWFSLARDAKRYDFFIGVGLAYFTATLLRDVSGRLWGRLLDPKWTTPAFAEHLTRRFFNETGVAAVVLLGVLVWSPHGGGHVFRTYASAVSMRQATPGTGELSSAYTWMKTHLPQNSVVAAEWSYGTQLTVLAGVRTITDPDHYLPYWIHLYHQHVEDAKTEQELIDFLFSHAATHLLVTTEKQPEGTLLRGGRLSGVFVARYPESDFENAPVKVWELRYPAGQKTRPEYLKARR